MKFFCNLYLFFNYPVLIINIIWLVNAIFSIIFDNFLKILAQICIFYNLKFLNIKKIPSINLD